MKASYLGAMGYSDRRFFPATWPVPPAYHDPETSVRSYEEGMDECEFAQEMGFDWISFSEHHYSGRIATGNPAVMAAAVAERCKKVKIAMLGQLLPLNNPVRCAEELAMLDNMTNGRVIGGFLRGTPNEDQTYGVNPSEGRGRLFEGMDLILKALTEPQPFSWEGTLSPVPDGGGMAAASAAAIAPGGRGHPERRRGEVRRGPPAGAGGILYPGGPDGSHNGQVFPVVRGRGMGAGAGPGGVPGEHLRSGDGQSGRRTGWSGRRLEPRSRAG